MPEYAQGLKGLEQQQEADRSVPFTLTYFPLMAKGFGPALCAELSGLPYRSNKSTGFTSEMWKAESGDMSKADWTASGKAPFGQLPALHVGDLCVAQAIAICNYIGKVSSTEGKDPAEYAMSQMLMLEGDDLYNALQKFQPTIFVPQKPEDNGKFWAETIPTHMACLERLIQTTPGEGFTSSSTAAGELYLFSMLFQMNLVVDEFLGEGHPAASPHLKKWFDHIKSLEKVQKVISGESEYGPIKQYFVAVA